MDVFSLPLTRDDFMDPADWHRHQHERCDPIELEESFNGIWGTNWHSQLMGGYLGASYYAYERTWPLRGARWSKHITSKQFEKAYRAVAFANCQGVIMDSQIDISWSTVGLKSDMDKNNALQRFLDGLHRWLDRHGAPPMVLWVQERGSRMGLHTHILLHVPFASKQAFRKEIPQILAAAMKRPLVTEGKVKTLHMEVRHSPAFVGDVRTQWIKFRYLMKGRSGRQGDVPFKRLGVSRCLDEAAVKAWLKTHHAPRELKKPSRPTPPLDDRFIRCFNGLDWHEAPELEPVDKMKKASQETDLERLIRVISQEDKKGCFA